MQFTVCITEWVTWCQRLSIRDMSGTGTGNCAGKVSTDPANIGNHLSHKLFQGNSPLKSEPPAMSIAFFCMLLAYRSFWLPCFFRAAAIPQFPFIYSDHLGLLGKTVHLGNTGGELKVETSQNIFDFLRMLKVRIYLNCFLSPSASKDRFKSWI